MSIVPTIKFCRECGHTIHFVIPPGDSRLRAVCPACGAIQYQNPINVVGTIPIWNDQVLLCRRNIEPRYGLWTLLAGFLEIGETTSEGAARETVEEAGATFNMGALFAVMNVVFAGQVHLFYLAQLTSDRFAPGPESIEARLFSENDIPWEHLAFRTIETALRLYFQDMQQHTLGSTVHTADLIK